MGCFPVDFQEVKRPLRTKSVKRPIKVGKRPINVGKLLHGLFSGTPAMVENGPSEKAHEEVYESGVFWAKPPWLSLRFDYQIQLQPPSLDPYHHPPPNFLNACTLHFHKE